MLSNKVKISKLNLDDMNALQIMLRPALEHHPVSQTDPMNCIMATVAGIFMDISRKIQFSYPNPGKKYSISLSTAQAFALQSYSTQIKTANNHNMAVFLHFNNSINQQLIHITTMRKI